MVSPISGIIAEAILQHLEKTVITMYELRFWARYVDDTFVLIIKYMFEHFKYVLNLVFPDIQLMMEEEVNN